MIAWLLACAIKAALFLAASWAGATLLRRSGAAARHQIWALGVAGALVLPLLCWVLPSLAPPAETAVIVTTTSLDAAAVQVRPGHALAAPSWPTWLALIWASGALVVAVRILRGHLAARRLVHAATSDVPASWSTALRSLTASQRIQLLRSTTISSPMTIGVRRPRVLLPAVADAWSPERLRAVLVHELGHVHRHDTAIQLAAQLACALYWWNPLAWLAAARLRVEREHACDDLVLGAGILPSSYAGDLLEVARSIAITDHASASCMVDRSWTEARLHRILDATTPRRPLRARVHVAMVALAVASAVTLGCTSSRPAERAPARGTLSIGAPSVRGASPLAPPVMMSAKGKLDLPLVTSEVQRRLPALEACYQRRLAARPALAGTVVIHWVIEESGKVPDACITEDTVGDNEIVDCVNKLVLEGGGFPAPRGGSVDVTLPFVFTAGG